MSYRHVALCGARRPALLLAGAALLALPALAHAAEPAPEPVADPTLTGTLDEIVVTAQKRKTDLQKTPIAISVLSGEALADRHIQSLVDLQSGGVPSLRVAPFYSRNSALIMNIRGIGVLSDSNQPARDQGVGVYVDGVYLGRAQGLGTALYDIENIEVLKGPQGTLFGRNTEGGAINIVTKKPSGEFHANALVGAGNYGSYKGEVHLDLPKWGNLAAKIDGVVSHRDGLVKNPLAGQTDFNFYTKRGLRGEVLWTPTSNFSADYAYDTSYDASSPLYAQTVSAGSLKRPAAYPLEPSRVGVAAVGVVQQPSVGKTHGHRLLLEWHLDPHLQVKSIASYRELTQSQYDNGSATTSAISATGNFSGAKFARYSLAQFRQNQASEELQLLGDYDRLKFVAGAMWYQEKVQDNAQAFYSMTFADAAGSTTTVIPYVNYDGVTIDRASHVTTTSVGVFGQGTFTPAMMDDMLHLTIGTRFTHDKKEGSLFTVNGATPSVNGVTAPRQLNASWSRVDPMVNLALDASQDVHLYGKWSTGYKSGGANSRSLTYAPFNPETVSMFELGAKTEFWGKRARFNVAAYTGSYKNIQLDFSANYLQYDAQGNLLNTTRTTTETHNAPGTGRLKGIEADFTVKPIPQLTLGASYAYTSVKIPNTSNPFPQANGVIITTPIPIYQVYTPKHAASGTVDVTLPVATSELRLHLDANYDNGFYANYVDPGFNTATGTVTLAQPKGDANVVFNGRVSLADIHLGQSGATMQVSVWGRNLFNEQHMFYKSASALVGTYGFFNEARTWGMEAQVRF